MKFLSYDSKFNRILLVFCYSCWLNLLWLICSIPIVTIGASTTALYYAALKIAKGEEGNVTTMFFRSFRQNFKQATTLWMILLAFGLFLGADGYILYHLRRTAGSPLSVIFTILLAVIIAAAILYVIVLLYVFPLLASVRNTTAAMLKNSLLIGTHYLFCTIVVFIIHFIVFFIIVRLFTPFVIAGEGFSAMMSSLFLWRVIAACSYQPEDADGSAQEAL